MGDTEDKEQHQTPPVWIKGLNHTRDAGKQVVQELGLPSGGSLPSSSWSFSASARLVMCRVADGILFLWETMINQWFSCMVQCKSSCYGSKHWGGCWEPGLLLACTINPTCLSQSQQSQKLLVPCLFPHVSAVRRLRNRLLAGEREWEIIPHLSLLFFFPSFCRAYEALRSFKMNVNQTRNSVVQFLWVIWADGGWVGARWVEDSSIIYLENRGEQHK